MSFIEFVGFIISMVALTLLSARKRRDEARRRQNPELYDKEQEQSLESLLRSMDIQTEEEEEREEAIKPPAPPLVIRKEEKSPKERRTMSPHYALDYQLNRFKQVRAIDQRRLTSAIEGRKIGRQVISHDMVVETDIYTDPRQVKISRGKALLKRLPSAKEMIMVREILSPPKSLLP